MESSLSIEKLDDFTVELSLPVIDESQLLTNYPDGQYCVLGDSSGGYDESPSILLHLSNYVQPSQQSSSSRDNSDINNDNKNFQLPSNELYGSNKESLDTSCHNVINKMESSACSESVCYVLNIPKVLKEQVVSSPDMSNKGSSTSLPVNVTEYAEEAESYHQSTRDSNSVNPSIFSTCLDDFDIFSSQSKAIGENVRIIEDENTYFTKNNENCETKFKPTLKTPISDCSNVPFISPFLLKDKISPKKFCPQCKSKYLEDRELKYFQLSLDCFILLCSTDKCTYPFDTPNTELNIQTYPIDEVLQSEIDFDINNIPLNTDSIQQLLSKQKSEIIEPFLNSLDHLKFNFERLKNGELKNVDDHGVRKSSASLMSFINQALLSNEENNEQESIVALKKESSSQTKYEVGQNNIDNYLEEQNRELQQMMLDHFV